MNKKSWIHYNSSKSTNTSIPPRVLIPPVLSQFPMSKLVSGKVFLSIIKFIIIMHQRPRERHDVIFQKENIISIKLQSTEGLFKRDQANK